MKMTPDEFGAMKKKFEDMRDEGFQQGQAELAQKIIEHMEELTHRIVRQSGTVMRVSDFQYFANNMINSMRSYQE